MYVSGADCETSKLERFQPLLETALLNLEELRQLSWSGIPVKVRAITWRLLSVNFLVNFNLITKVIFIFLVKVYNAWRKKCHPTLKCNNIDDFHVI